MLGNTLCNGYLVPVTLALQPIVLSEVILILPIVLIGAIVSEAYIFFIYTKGDLSIIGTIFPTYSIFTIFFSYLIIEERLNAVDFSGITFTILEILILATPDEKLDWRKHTKSVLWALPGTIGIGSANTLAK